MMSRNKALMMIAAVTLMLTGCSDDDSGSSGSSPTDPDTEFNLAGNPLQLQRGISMDLSGSDSNGDAWSGSLRVRTLDQVQINGELLTPIETTVELTGPDGVFSRNQSTGYMDSQGQILMKADASGLQCGITHGGDYPEIAKIGDFGNLARYACNDDSTESGTWCKAPEILDTHLH